MFPKTHPKIAALSLSQVRRFILDKKGNPKVVAQGVIRKWLPRLGITNSSWSLSRSQNLFRIEYDIPSNRKRKKCGDGFGRRGEDASEEDVETLCWMVREVKWKGTWCAVETRRVPDHDDDGEDEGCWEANWKTWTYRHTSDEVRPLLRQETI